MSPPNAGANPSSPNAGSASMCACMCVCVWRGVIRIISISKTAILIK